MLTVFSGQVYSQEAASAPEPLPEGEPAETVEVRDESGYRFAPAPGDGDTPGAAAGQGTVSAFGVGDLLRMLLVLLMVIGCVYGIVAFLRRRIPTQSDDSDSPIRVLASRNIGGNRDLYAVMIGRQVILLGGGDSSLQLITTVEDQETIDELVLASSSAATAAPQRTFGTVLGRWLGNVTIPGSATRGESEASQIRSFLNVQHARLRKMR